MKYHTMSVGEIVTAIPQAMEYFTTVHIDYCCGGYQKLAKVIEELGLDEKEVYTHLDTLSSNMQSIKKYTQMNVIELCEYIVNTHHVYLRKVLPRIEEYSNAVMRAHGIRHPELFTLGKLIGQLHADLQQHLIKEEEILFPLLKKNAKVEAQTLSTIIITEHEEAGVILEKIRELTNQYLLPDDACKTYSKLFDSLQEMENDLHTHIHLENNILLKKFDNRK